MAATESDLNPQLFINQVLNSVDDLVDGAFHYYLQEASTLLQTGGTDRSHDLSKNDSLCDTSIYQEALSSPDVDSQLASLKNKLAAVGKESAELNRELRALERQSDSSNHSAGVINKALQLYEENSMHDLFQEMVQTASQLRTEMEKLTTKRMEENGHNKMERIYSTEINLCTMNHSKWLSNARLENLQELLADIKM